MNEQCKKLSKWRLLCVEKKQFKITRVSQTKKISFAWYKKNKLVKITVFTCIYNFKCLLNPYFTSNDTENVIKRNLKLSRQV